MNQKVQRKNAPSPGGRPSIARRLLVVPVPEHEAVLHQLAPNRLERAAHPRIVGRQEPEERDRQQARVESLRVVVLDERAELLVVAALEHLRVDLVTNARQRSTAPSRPYSSTALTPRSNATHAITFECVK